MNQIHLKTLAFLALLASLFSFSCGPNKQNGPEIGLSLIPPTQITNLVNLDIRAGLKNKSANATTVEVTLYLNAEKPENIIHQAKLELAAHAADFVKFSMPTKDKVGMNKIILKVKGDGFEARKEKEVEIVASTVRSNKKIGGAWISFYHWSEEEGKMWNPALKKMTDEQWKELVRSMHELGMDIIVIQESFRNQEYVGKHNMDRTGYTGKAFYPSKLFPARMPIAAKDPIEAVLSEADQLGMHVMMGVGMYAWFDYTPGSLAWHKKVAQELYEMYGQHNSFYGFYVSEEGMGSLDCFETEPAKQEARRQEVLNFFKSFRPFVKQLAPDKPVMFAPNGWGVGRAGNAYYELLKNVDMISPFAFNRMPEGDLTGKAAIDLLQKYCDETQTHLWLDLEAFLFKEKEGYLYPRPMSEIKYELDHYDNFERVICYQYPGVFSNPKASIQVGENSTIKLFQSYQKYVDSLSRKSGNRQVQK
ncbi:MAG: DUF4434 domain-containing protein [Pedobacter sp.]|nr:DUF4434 domain-containing protein [Pedobacter sp.]MDQ8054315.1 DUF4434 domain-containing protein [Pedobacter sp.]